MPFDQSSKRIFEIGTEVRFKPQYLLRRPDDEKRFAGRVGKVSGYRLGAADPIVDFPRDGRRKERRVFEAPSEALAAAE